MTGVVRSFVCVANHEHANLSHVSLAAHITGLKNLPTEELSASQGGVVVRVVVGVPVSF